MTRARRRPASMKPGASQVSLPNWRSGMIAGSSARGMTSGDAGAVDDDRRVPVDRHAVENARGGDGVNAAPHRVRVTFCKWRGCSTSAPRRCAKRTRKA
jgi:hypothetical protein